MSVVLRSVFQVVMIERVSCVPHRLSDFRYSYHRLEYHSHLEDLNDSWLQRHMPKEENQDIRADGDAHLSTDDFSDFQVTECKHCGEGIVKPKIVFFGGL